MIGRRLKRNITNRERTLVPVTEFMWKIIVWEFSKPRACDTLPRSLEM